VRIEIGGLLNNETIYVRESWDEDEKDYVIRLERNGKLVLKMKSEETPWFFYSGKLIESRKRNGDVATAVDVLTNILYEIRIHSSSPFFINLSKEVERTYEELRTRKIDIEEAMRRSLAFSKKIVKWKKEEEEIGKERYPLYEVIKSVLPELDKQEAIDFINTLLSHLKNKNCFSKVGNSKETSGGKLRWK
jgi:hypothetical protein